jgi:Tfp pilus assembly protein PilF
MSNKLQQAITFIKSGNKDSGRQCLIDVLEADPKNEVAWLWMSAIVESDDLR